MTSKGAAEKQSKQVGQQQSLKGALADVLAKNTVSLAPMPARTPPPSIVPTHSGREADQGIGSKQPFEVPEDTLRKVLKGEA